MSIPLRADSPARGEGREAPTPPPKPAVTADATRVVLPIRGMHCAACVNTIETALRRAEGVQDVTVSLAAEQASVAFDPRRNSVDRLRGIVREAGYEALAP